MSGNDFVGKEITTEFKEDLCESQHRGGPSEVRKVPEMNSVRQVIMFGNNFVGRVITTDCMEDLYESNHTDSRREVKKRIPEMNFVGRVMTNLGKISLGK